MKKLMTSLCLFVIALSFGQTGSKSLQSTTQIEKPELNSIAIQVQVDSAEDLENTFNIEDLKEVFALSAEDQDITLKIICNGEPMSNGVKSSMSYKIKGNTSDIDSFLKQAEKIRNGAIGYYNSK